MKGQDAAPTKELYVLLISAVNNNPRVLIGLYVCLYRQLDCSHSDTNVRS